MAQKPFGSILAEERERQGMDIAYASQELRIREDILHAIEHNDFSRMPARGYTRNMVNAYARLLGLNAPSVTRQYLDEANAYQVSLRSGGERSRRSDRYGDRRPAGEGRAYGSRESGAATRNSRGRLTYSDRPERSQRSNGRGVGYEERSRNIRGGRPSRSNGYVDRYSQSQGQGNPILQRLPLIIGAIVVVILVIFIATQIISCATPKQTATTSVPITGVSDTTGTDEQNTNTNANAVVETAPTSVAVTYTVKSGYSTYVEFYENGSTTPTADVLTGPVTGAFTVTNKLVVYVVNPDAFTLTVDGQEVQLTLDSDTSMYTYTVDFASILNAWAQTHKSATSNTSTTNTTKTNTTNTTSTSA